MGSFHRSCFLTQLPITDGDPVVGFVLLHRADARALRLPIHPTGAWAPISLPLTGAYSGYGWMDADGTRMNQVATAMLDVVLAAGAQITTASPDGSVEPRPYTHLGDLDAVHELIHDGDVFVPSPHRFHTDGRAPLTVALCHAEAWHFLLDTPIQAWEEEDTTVATLLDDADAVLEVALATLGTRSLSIADTLPQDWAALAQPNIRGNGLNAGAVSLVMPLVSAAVFAQQGNSGDAMLVLRGLASVLVANSHMDALHRTWAPGIGASQDEEWALVARFQTLIADLAERACDAYGGDGADD